MPPISVMAMGRCVFAPAPIASAGGIAPGRLGARPADVRRMALGGGLRLVLAGAALGVVGALALARLTASVLYGVTPSDPPTVAAALLVLGTATLLACWLPARRAARVDPAVALRYE